jgi:hypothetical protein
MTTKYKRVCLTPQEVAYLCGAANAHFCARWLPEPKSTSMSDDVHRAEEKRFVDSLVRKLTRKGRA